jgi:Cu(I)/Ag(I) efflux system membrane protein CusA/SilA
MALLGVDSETGVFILLYLDIAYAQAKREGRLESRYELQQATLNGALKRLPPKFMTVEAMTIGLIPIMWSIGPVARIA